MARVTVAVLVSGVATSARDSQCALLPGKETGGVLLKTLPSTSSAGECCQKCMEPWGVNGSGVEGCFAYSWNRDSQDCSLKSGPVGTPHDDACDGCMVSGTKACTENDGWSVEQCVGNCSPGSFPGCGYCCSDKFSGPHLVSGVASSTRDSQCALLPGKETGGIVLKTLPSTSSAGECCQKCMEPWGVNGSGVEGCYAYSWNRDSQDCSLKSGPVGTPHDDDCDGCMVSGTKACTENDGWSVEQCVDNCPPGSFPGCGYCCSDKFNPALEIGI